MVERGPTSEAFRLVAESGLPRDVQERITALLEESRLSGGSEVDVARELIAHFDDGLAAGKSASHLLRAFGDERRTARWIAEQKRKGDPLPYTLARNVRYAARRLMQSPGFTVTALLSLALGIGANTAIFSLVNAVILEDAPVTNERELVSIYTWSPEFPYVEFAYPDFEDLRDDTGDAFVGLTATSTTITQVDRDGNLETILSEAVSGNHFSLLGIQAEIGRTLRPEDDVRPGAHPIVMLSHGYWQRAFGGDLHVLGRDLRITGRPYTIVGVTPEGYHGHFRGIQTDIYVPAMMYDEIQGESRSILEARDSHRFSVIGRLGPDVTMPQAQLAVDQVAEQFRRDFDWASDTGFLLVPQADIILHPRMDRFIRAAAWLLSSVVGIVLLIACTNLAGFLLARSLERRKEIAIRLAMGAKRRSLVGQILTETTLMSLLGGLIGIAVARGLLYILTTAELPIPVPLKLDLSMDGTVLLFSLGASVVAGLILGLIPALQSTRLDIAPTLKDEATVGSRRRLSLRNGLVTAQVAVCLPLLIGAGLFLRSLQEAQSMDPGFGKEPAAMVSVGLSARRYSEDEGRRLMRQLLARVEELPGVQSVGITHNMHLRKLGRDTTVVQVDGIEPPPDRSGHSVDESYVDAGFFDAVGIRILRGRNFNESDRTDTARVAIVNDAFARRFFPGKDPLGGTIRREGNPDLTIVGIVGDAKIRDLNEPPRPFLYHAYSQTYSAYMDVVARTSSDSERLALDLVATARELDPELVLWAPKTMERHLGFVLLPLRLSAFLLAASAVLGIALAVVGLYGVVSYAVSQRTREVGIRMSFGASVGKLTWMLMGVGMKLVLVGAGLGLVASYFLSQGLRGLLYEVSSLDLATFLAAPLILVMVAAVASFVAARRASRIDPVTALRS